MVIRMGSEATWTAGLICGVAILIANNPRKTTPQLPYRTLYRLLPLPAATAALFACLAGLAGYLGLFNPFFQFLFNPDLNWRPRRFMSVWGAHLGGYIGAILGLLTLVVYVLIARRKLRLPTNHPTPSPTLCDKLTCDE